MRLYLFLVCLMGSLLSPIALAVEDKFQFDSPQKNALFLELAKELRCPKCQNQNIAESDAMIAVDLKRKVHQLVSEGYERQEIIDFMKQRYGDFVYYQPPVNAMTIWLWLIPLFFVLAAALGITLNRKRQPQSFDDGELKKADDLLERDK